MCKPTPAVIEEPQKQKADVQATWRKHGWLPLAERQAKKQHEKVVDRVVRLLIMQHDSLKQIN